MLYRFRILAMAAAAIGAAAFAAHAVSQPPAPGRTLTWAAPETTAAPAAPSAIATATPTAVPQPNGPLGGLVAPLNALLQRLNADTRDVAHGQYSILQELEGALRDRIDQFLRWVTAGR